MREIKFRALYEGVWYYQTLEEIITVTLAAFRNGAHKTQYTELKDKNDNEIYEGDIVTGCWWSGYIYDGVIKFGTTKDLDYNFYGWYVEYTNHNGWTSNESIHKICKSFQIIGNIYQKIITQ
jgi:hypothetical protein